MPYGVEKQALLLGWREPVETWQSDVIQHVGVHRQQQFHVVGQARLPGPVLKVLRGCAGYV